MALTLTPPPPHIMAFYKDKIIAMQKPLSHAKWDSSSTYLLLGSQILGKKHLRLRIILIFITTSQVVADSPTSFEKYLSIIL